MLYSFAPMEGVTGSLYRRTHAAHFPGVDRYYIPFLEPKEFKLFSGRDKREIQPEENAGICAIPQLLTNNAQRFLEAARLLCDLGYPEVNLNLGCPARTVVTKGKGSGFLEHPVALEDFLDEVMTHSPLPVSVKTRLGVSEEEEFTDLLTLYRNYPLTELIVHTRVQTDYYKKPARPDSFAAALENAPWPVCYNGDLLSPARYDAFTRQYPHAQRVMLGRGLIANPALVRQCDGGAPLTGRELKEFHDDLLERYRSFLSGDHNVLHWMKELWFYQICLYPQAVKEDKAIRKAKNLSEYLSAAERIFAQYEPEVEPGYNR